jgi:primosomal protein N' (replication factor Y) (superfamily II helicase)
VTAADDGAAARSVAAALRDALTESAPTTPDTGILGPAPLFRLRGKARSQLVIKAADRRAAIGAVGAAVDVLARDAGRRKVSISVDVDPQ